MKYINNYLKYPMHIPSKTVYMFTGNRVVCKGQLIMGGGNALECAKAYPMIPTRLAKANIKPTVLNYFTDYHDGLVGCMFTKNHYKDPSPLDMVIAAIEDLGETARTKGKAFTFHVPYPAIGLGGLTRDQLDSHIEKLPDNVIIYYV